MRLIKFTRTHWVLHGLLAAAVVTAPGCGSGDFLGLEDYQRDLITGGLLAAALLNRPAATDVPAEAGVDGRDGDPGISCWDTNGDRIADTDEDVNGDGNYNTLDCVGPAGADGATGGGDGADGISCWDINGNRIGDGAEDINGDGNFDALDCKGSAGSPGADGPEGSPGSDGAPGADGMALFSIFVDDFFSTPGTPNGDLPVQTVSVTEPVLGMIPRVSADVTIAVAYRVVIPQMYDEGNDVTMRIFFHRTGLYEGDCFIFRIDGKRLRNGSTIEDYGTPRWVRVETPEAVPTGSVTGEGGGDPVDLEIEALLVVDLPLNTAAGLGLGSLAVSDFLAFQLSTEREDGGAYHLVGVEFTESRQGTASTSGAQVFTSQDELSCDFIDCDENGVPDSTDIAQGNGSDCNGNGTLDFCDIRDEFSSDCQRNDIPDECEEDCNSNGVPDDCDIATPQAVVTGPGGLLFPLDGSYQLVDFFGDGCTGSGCAQGTDQHNDDDSATVALPFSFDLYGAQFTSTFVNNNGNVSFGQPFSTFTAEGFPVGGFPMVAPFWGDVDTGNPTNHVGDVWMRFFDGSNNGSDDTLVVTWQDVGYYDERGDLRNTFQLAMSDGTNPDMGLGNNVCFSYERMEWTTGEASDGIDGFGGVPATVGANAGNGTNFFQIGRFDHAGTDYDGPGGNADGVGYLVGQQICLNSSTSTFNINPIPSNFPPGNTVTVLASEGGTLDLDLQFLSPEVDQTTTVTHAVVTVSGSGSTGLTVDHTPGTVATSHLTYSPDCTQVGTYDVVFTATDDFDPPGVTEVTLRIVVTCETVDCNSNGVPDECDVRDGTSPDCNSNGIPDECDGGCIVDCNSNGTSDEIDISESTSEDCNTNGIPDECDIADGTSDDCQTNGIPDECDGGCGFDDCNSNETPDDVDISVGTSKDCNENSVPDECDIDDGTSSDCQPNGIPDECDVVGAEPGSAAGRVEGRGKVYWTDYLNNKIQQVDLDGVNFRELVTTGLEQAAGIALDVDGGKMYWADQIGTIKRADLDGSNVEEVVTSVARPIGIALDVAGGKMYWTESANPVRKIQRANLDGSNVEDLISTTSLGLDSPWGITLDLPNGKLYWTDTGGFIMRADLDGSNVERLVRRSNSSDFWPTGIAVDSAGGKIYWTEDYYNKIQSANLEIPEGEADWNRTDIEDLVINVNLPGEIALDVAVHKMYWVDYYSGTIKRAGMDGSNVETVFEVGRSILFGIALELSPIVSQDCNSNGVPDSCDVRDGTSDDCQTNGIPDECDGGCSFDDCNSNGVPDEIDIAGETSPDCNGNTVPDECDIGDGTSDDCDENGVPDECDASAPIITEIIDVLGDGAGNGLDSPRGMVVDAAGNAFIAGRRSHNAFKITPTGVITEIIDATGDGAGHTLNAPVGMAADAAGNVYVTGLGSNNVFKITPAGVITEIIDSTGDGAGNILGFPVGIEVDAAGNVYVTGESDSNVFKITPAGVISEIIDSTGDGAGNALGNPHGITMDAAGNIYVSGINSHNAFKITPAGVITQIIDITGDGAGNDLWTPRSIAVDAAGNVYVAGDSTNNAFKITPAGVITLIIDSTGDGAGNTFMGPRAIAADAVGNVYVSAIHTNNAFKITPAGVITQIIGGSGDGAGNTLVGPHGGLAFDAAGNLYLTGEATDNAFKIALAAPDCNSNGIPDTCDLRDGTSRDCNSNAVPDECDIDDGTSEDCQSNNIPDMCDIRDGTSNDNDSNGVPDECAPAAFFGPIPYLMVRHSPWGYTGLGPDFYWERFETGALTTPGVSISVPGFVRPPSTRTDSVDADDGLLDGRGQGGHSYWFGGSDPNVTIKFTFDEATLGFLPTHAGIVWTDGTGTITFEAFDASGASLGTVTGNHAGVGDGGQTDEDRFYGIVDSGGISAISISNVGVQMEVDHLMYGIPTSTD